MRLLEYIRSGWFILDMLCDDSSNQLVDICCAVEDQGGGIDLHGES